MGLTESGPILESVRFVKLANYEWKDISRWFSLIVSYHKCQKWCGVDIVLGYLIDLTLNAFDDL